MRPCVGEYIIYMYIYVSVIFWNAPIYMYIHAIMLYNLLVQHSSTKGAVIMAADRKT